MNAFKINFNVSSSSVKNYTQNWTEALPRLNQIKITVNLYSYII